MRRLAALLITSVFVPASAAAEDDSNVFKAELSNPDLSVTVSQFEKICLPFVLHKTMTTPKIDKAHYAQLLKGLKFDFVSKELLRKKYEVESGQTYWRPKSQPINKGGSTVVLNTGEITNNDVTVIPPKYVTLPSENEVYNLQSDNRLSAYLGWNYPSQDHPGKSCEYLKRLNSFQTSSIKMRIGENI